MEAAGCATTLSAGFARNGNRRGDDGIHREVERTYRRRRYGLKRGRTRRGRNRGNVESCFLRRRLLHRRTGSGLGRLNKTARLPFEIRRLLHGPVKNRAAKQRDEDCMQRKGDREIPRIAELIEHLLNKRRKLLGHMRMPIYAQPGRIQDTEVLFRPFLCHGGFQEQVSTPRILQPTGADHPHRPLLCLSGCRFGCRRAQSQQGRAGFAI